MMIHRDTDTSVIRGVGGGSRKAIAKCWDIDRTFIQLIQVILVILKTNGYIG